MFSTGDPDIKHSSRSEVTTIAERIFSIVAGLLLLTAFVMLWRNNLSAAFVIATLGIVSWFLGYRAQLKAKIAAEAPSARDKDVNQD